MAVQIPDKEVQKVKLVGGLWTFKLVLSILRDLLLIILVFVVIGVLVYLASSVSQLANSFGGVAGLSSLVGGSNGGGNNGGLEQTLQTQLQEFQQDVNLGDWNAALTKLNGFEMLANQVGAPSEMKMMISELKSAVKAKDKTKVSQLLSQFNAQNR